MKTLYQIVTFVAIVSLSTALGLLFYDACVVIGWNKNDGPEDWHIDPYFFFATAIAFGSILYGIFLEKEDND